MLAVLHTCFSEVCEDLCKCSTGAVEVEIEGPRPWKIADDFRHHADPGICVAGSHLDDYVEVFLPLI